MNHKRNPYSRLLLSGALAVTLVGAAPVGCRVAGFTTNDQQVLGPPLTRIVHDPVHGTHVAWKDDAGRGTYNFLDATTDAWRWSGGIPIFERRVRFGNIATSPIDLRLTAAGSYLSASRYNLIYARDPDVGSGGFVVTEPSLWYECDHAVGGLTRNGWRHFAVSAGDSIFYTRGASPTRIGRSGPFPSHNLAASGNSDALAIFWTRTVSPDKGVLFLRRSTNSGYNWRDTSAISRSIPGSRQDAFLGAQGIYDADGNLHLAVNTWDGSDIRTSELWHFCETDTPAWSPVRSAVASPGSGEIPPEALVAGRPSLGWRAETGELFMLWEQFDDSDCDPTTGILRADIWAARSADRGRTWGPATRLTFPDATSKRFPGLAACVNESLHITYLVDSVSGVADRGQGRATRNPVIYQAVPASRVVSGLTESRTSPAADSRFGHRQAPVILTNRRLRVCFASSALPARLHLLDRSGRVARVWQVAPGLRELTLDLRESSQPGLSAGVYFLVHAWDGRLASIRFLGR